MQDTFPHMYKYVWCHHPKSYCRVTDTKQTCHFCKDSFYKHDHQMVTTFMPAPCLVGSLSINRCTSVPNTKHVSNFKQYIYTLHTHLTYTQTHAYITILYTYICTHLYAVVYACILRLHTILTVSTAMYRLNEKIKFTHQCKQVGVPCQ